MCVYELCHSNVCVCVCALGVSGFEQLLPFLLKLWGEMMKLGAWVWWETSKIQIFAAKIVTVFDVYSHHHFLHCVVHSFVRPPAGFAAAD